MRPKDNDMLKDLREELSETITSWQSLRVEAKDSAKRYGDRIKALETRIGELNGRIGSIENPGPLFQPTMLEIVLERIHANEPQRVAA